MELRASRPVCLKLIEVYWIRFSHTCLGPIRHLVGLLCSFSSGNRNMRYFPIAVDMRKKLQLKLWAHKWLRGIHRFHQSSPGAVWMSSYSEWPRYQISKQLPSKFCNHTGRLQTSFRKRPLIVSVWKLVLLSHNLVELLWFNHPLVLSIPSY